MLAKLLEVEAHLQLQVPVVGSFRKVADAAASDRLVGWPRSRLGITTHGRLTNLYGRPRRSLSS